MSTMHNTVASRFTIALLVLLCVSFSAQAEPRLRPATWGKPIIGSQFSNLYQIDKEVYRSEQPDEEGVSDLQALAIKEILNLREYHSDDGEVGKSNFILERVPMDAGKVTQQQVVQALRIIKNRKGPILIHCWHGSDRTGVTVAAYRIVFNNWTKQQALDEMIHGGYGYHASFYPNLVELVKNFDIKKMRTELGLSTQHAEQR
jgi:tyrosine-protein phosphatase SIW14